MLKAEYIVTPTEMDLVVFEKLIPADHYLRRLKAAIDFESLRALVGDCYAARMGAPAEDPVRLLKLSLLQFQYDLSDSQVVRQAQVNVAFRFFLNLSVESVLPVPSLLSQFRTRLGAERCTRIFNDILRQARARGLVKDRLRLKDATHLIANIAIPSTLRLVAQTREQVLVTAEGFAASDVAVQRAQIDAMRTATADLSDEQRLLARVTHLRELVVWGEQWQQRLREAAESAQPMVSEEQAVAFSAALEVAHKVRNDRKPGATDKLLSLVDSDARAGKHGDYYDGYLLDVSMDADSELIGALDVLPANGDEGANATSLITSEEHAHAVDLITFDRAFYVEPGAGAKRAFALLVEVPRQSGMVALGTANVREHERLIVPRPSHEALILHALFAPTDMLSPERLALSHCAPYPIEIKAAQEWVARLSSVYVPEQWVDHAPEVLSARAGRKAKIRANRVPVLSARARRESSSPLPRAAA